MEKTKKHLPLPSRESSLIEKAKTKGSYLLEKKQKKKKIQNSQDHSVEH